MNASCSMFSQILKLIPRIESYANAHRPWQLFERVFYRLFERVSGSVRASCN